MKAILLIGNTSSSGAQRLKEEAQRLGIVFDAISPSLITFADGQLTVQDTSLSLDITQYDVYFFRGIRHFEPQMQKVAAFLNDRGKRVVEQVLTHGLLPEDKLVPASKQGLYVVPNSVLVTKTNATSYKPNTFPVVVKKLRTSLGEGVKRIDSQEAFAAFMATSNEPLLVQAYHHIDFDIRVLVVGDEILGAFARYKLETNDFLTTARGGKRDPFELTDVMKAAALEATHLQGLEIAGVDMFLVDGKPYIIEVNASPQFKVFEKKMEVNVAEKILTYLVQ